LSDLEKFGWVRQPQECEGDYFFNGTCYATKGINEKLPKHEIAIIINDLFDFISEQSGVDYLQIYIRQYDQLKIYVIDQLSKSMMESGDYTPEDINEYNYFTILLPSEY